MKRESISAAILLMLTALSVWNIHRIDTLTQSIESLLSTSEQAAESDPDAALSYAQQALELWLQADGYTHIFIRHPEIDSTSDAFYELLTALREGETDDLSPAYGKLRYHLDSIAGMEHVSIGSVL